MAVLPISPSAGATPPEAGSHDEDVTVDHILALLTGAQQWLELLDMQVGVAWNSLERAIDDVNKATGGRT